MLTTIHLAHAADYQGWRQASRQLIRKGKEPSSIIWDSGSQSGDLFSAHEQSSEPADQSVESTDPAGALSVPRAFLELAEYVCCHRDADRFALLYRVLWRMQQGERRLLERHTDPDVHRLQQLRKAVARDRHKMTAFVRFRRTPEIGAEHYSAWFEPDHHILRLTSHFFVRRFCNLRWSLFTPDGCAHWDGRMIRFAEAMERDETPHAQRHAIPQGERMEDLWRTYFANIFNPARLRLDAMRAEMPVKYWKNLPEAPLIAQLVHESGQRTREMVTDDATSPARFAARAVAPTARTSISTGRQSTSLAELNDELESCQICPHACRATRVVPGQGRPHASIMLVGEQPGDQEDLSGQVFVGPAGQLLRSVLAQLDVDESDLYLTNAVKHFRYTVRGKRRLHQRPDRDMIRHCRSWLFEELRLVGPRVVVALGATAGQALLDRAVRVESERGQLQTLEGGRYFIQSGHPAHPLRARDPSERKQLTQALRLDLELAVRASRSR